MFFVNKLINISSSIPSFEAENNQIKSIEQKQKI